MLNSFQSLRSSEKACVARIVFALITCLTLRIGSAHAGKLDTPLPPQGMKINYDVLLDDNKIGEHKIYVHKAGNEVNIEHAIDLKAKVAFITVYQLKHHSTEVWLDEGPRKARLVRYHGKSTENGNDIEVSGQATPDGFVVEGPGGSVTAPKDVGTTDSFWVSVSTTHPKVLDNVKGTLVTAAVHNEGNEVLDGKSAQKFLLKTDGRNAEGWFADDLLVKAVIDRDGHKIQYVPQH